MSLPTVAVNGFAPGVETGAAATSLGPLTPAAWVDPLDPPQPTNATVAIDTDSAPTTRDRQFAPIDT
jgi:hypothetical protein